MCLLTATQVYVGSDGEMTKAFYKCLHLNYELGEIAVNLFRTQKCSERAKVYRGGIRGRGSFKSMAYDRKQWSMDLLCRVLAEPAPKAPSLVWGWKEDPEQPFHKWVLYVEIPTGQVSFHTDRRGEGPEYPGQWDGKRGETVARILQFVDAVHNMQTEGDDVRKTTVEKESGDHGQT